MGSTIAFRAMTTQDATNHAAVTTHAAVISITTATSTTTTGTPDPNQVDTTTTTSQAASSGDNAHDRYLDDGLGACLSQYGAGDYSACYKSCARYNS